MYLEDSLLIIIELLTQKTENRAYFTYTLSNLLSKDIKPYKEYLEIIGLVGSEESEVCNENINKEEIRRNAKEIRNKFLKSFG